MKRAVVGVKGSLVSQAQGQAQAQGERRNGKGERGEKVREENPVARLKLLLVRPSPRSSCYILRHAILILMVC